MHPRCIPRAPLPWRRECPKAWIITFNFTHFRIVLGLLALQHFHLRPFRKCLVWPQGLFEPLCSLCILPLACIEQLQPRIAPRNGSRGHCMSIVRHHSWFKCRPMTRGCILRALFLRPSKCSEVYYSLPFASFQAIYVLLRPEQFLHPKGYEML